MIKVLLILGLNISLYAQCTKAQYNDAMNTWHQSIHAQETEKIALFVKANEFCSDIPIISLDIKIHEASKNFNLNTLRYLTNLNNDLSTLNTEQEMSHKRNNFKRIDLLWLEYYKNEEKRILSQKSADSSALSLCRKNIKYLKKHPYDTLYKAVSNVGGLYKADLLFDKEKSKIKDIQLSQKIIDAMHNEIKQDSNVLFGLEGGASSGGTASYNTALSKRRAKALEAMLLKQHPNYKNNIKVFAEGENQLVCEGGLLPEVNTKGEYQCITKEDKAKSRRVRIRRVR